jgi:hypothetical protein
MKERAHFVAISYSGSQSSTTAHQDIKHNGALHKKILAFANLQQLDTGTLEN